MGGTASYLGRVAVLGVLLIVILALFYRGQYRAEQRRSRQEAFSRGSHLVSLISLYRIDDLDEKERSYLLRTLTEYVSREGLQYLFVHDATGKVMMSLAPEALTASIPADILGKSLASDALLVQPFPLANGDTVYEFAKPMFGAGARSGTIRLGLLVPRVAVFSLQRVSTFAIVFLLVLTAAMSVYNVASKALTRLHRSAGVDLSDAAQPMPDTPPSATGGIGGAVAHLDYAIAQLKERLRTVNSDNEDLASQVGVLAFERNLMSRILDNLDLGIVILDFKQSVYQVNRYVASLLGRKREELVDQPLPAVISDRELLDYVQRYEGTTLGRRPEAIETALPETCPGSVYRVSLSAVQDTEGEPLAQLLIMHDITDQRATDRTKQDFVINLAHELLNPLTSVKAYTEMLMDDQVTDPETQKEFYNTINREIERLEGLVKNFLNISKMEVGGMTLNRNIVRSDWFVNDCLPVIEKAAQDKGMTLERNLPDTYPSLYADKELLKVALVNILGNAVKYTPSGGHVAFALWSSEKDVYFEVKDTGLGISEDALPHIFEKFYRAGDAGVSEQMGSGLGLAITDEIVRLHGGSIDVESDVGHGSRFVIRIPRQEYYIGSR